MERIKDDELVQRFYRCGFSNIQWVYIVQPHMVIVITISHQENVSCKEITLLQYVVYGIITYNEGKSSYSS